MAKIKVIIKRTDEVFGHVANISDSLHNLQKTVGGPIETVTLFRMAEGRNVIIICNEEGRIRHLPYNCTVCGIDFYGDIIVAQTCRDDLMDLEMSYDVWKRALADQI